MAIQSLQTTSVKFPAFLRMHLSSRMGSEE
jgi:hypothetical protein